jgi:transposase InsO family protein
LASGQSESHPSGQGIQDAVTAHVTIVREAGVAISMEDVGEPTQNGYSERLRRITKEEYDDLITDPFTGILIVRFRYVFLTVLWPVRS